MIEPIGIQLARIFNMTIDESEQRITDARRKLAAGVYDNNPRITRITAERVAADLLELTRRDSGKQP